MKRLRYFPYVLFGILACACLIYALCTAKEITVVEFVGRPFAGICAAIRNMYDSGNAVGAWCLYLFISFLPLVIFVVICAVRRKFCLHSLVWMALSACTFAAVYLGINRHLFASVLISSTEEYYSLIVAAICFVWLGVAMLCIFVECGYSLKKRRTSAYTLGQIIIYFFAVVCIINTFYIHVTNATFDASLIENTTLSEEDKALNVLAVVMSAAAKCLTAVTTVVFLCILAQFLCELKRDSLSVGAVRLLKAASIAGKTSVLTIICLTLVSNIVVLSAVKSLVAINFSVTIPLFELISVCFSIIAVEILKRAIAADEENKLTI